jgi:regulator of PEP synthase PpsR (kinase-PPPase family)
VRTIVIGNIRSAEQVTQARKQAEAARGLIVHTLVDAHLRAQLAAEARAAGIQTIDLMGPLIGLLTAALHQPPLQQPGKYRQLHREYFGRVAAIDFALAHDDGKNPEGWSQAEIVLVGVSRSGKTPLSMYLAVLGWKVANYPLVPQIPVPQALFALDQARVFGLTIDAEQLLVYRRQRQAGLGVPDGQTAYTDLEAIEEELRLAKKVFRQGNFHVINMTDRTIEQAADEIIRRRAGTVGTGPY